MSRYPNGQVPCVDFCDRLRTLKRVGDKLPGNSDLLFQLGVTSNSQQASWTLGTWKELQQRHSCSICQLVVSTILEGRIPADGSIDPAHEIRSLLYPEEEAFRLSFVDARLAFVADGGHDASGPDNARLVVGSRVQPVLVQKWLRTCLEKHGLTCGAKQQTVFLFHCIFSAIGSRCVIDRGLG